MKSVSHTARCECSQPNHILAADFCPTTDKSLGWCTVWVTVLPHLPLWKRVKAAVRFVCGGPALHYDTVELSVDDAKAFRDLFNAYVNDDLSRVVKERLK